MKKERGGKNRAQGDGEDRAGTPLLGYRQGVAAIILNDDKQVLMGAALDPVVGWHFPQGGMEEGEREEDALWRELLEELGTTEFQLLAKSQDRWRYEFPQDLRIALNTSYVGQEHRYFLLHLVNASSAVLRPDPQEFRFLQWVPYQRVPQVCVVFKREVYIRVLEEFHSVIEALPYAR